MPTAAATANPAAAGGGRFRHQGVVVGMLLFVYLWLWQLNFTSLAPPTDDLEQLTWVRSLQWGYYKHPPLPTWLLWPLVKLFGWSAWTVYAAGAATTLAAFVLFWRLLAGLRGERYALVALLAAACITYYNGRLNYYNHNTVLLLASSACALLTWQAFATRQLRWWLALGVAMGLGALSKYQIVVTAGSAVVFAWQQQAWRDAAHRRGLLWASVVALAIVAPHLAWLLSHDFGPLGYAMQSSLGKQLGPLARSLVSVQWLADQALNRALPALLLLLWVAVRLPRRTRADTPSSPPPPSSTAAMSRALLLAWGLVPLLGMPLLGLAVGADLQLQWGTPFLLFAVPATMELLASRVAWSEVKVSSVLAGFVALQLLLLTLNLVTSPRGVQGLRSSHWRNVDAQAVANTLAAPARAALGGPVLVIIGPAPLAGAIALQLPEHPLVLIDGRLDHSPWVPADAVARCGAIHVLRSAQQPSARPFGAVMPGWSWIAVPATRPSACTPATPP